MEGSRILAGLAAAGLAASAAGQIYVDATVVGGANDGSSWSNAFRDLQDALAVGGGSHILVARGVYKPGTARTDTFRIPAGATLLGGFPSGGGARNPRLNPTLLSGDIGVVGDASDNSRHVVVVQEADVTIDGFRIVFGRADGTTAPAGYGGGMLVLGASPVVRQCLFRYNTARSGGGVFVRARQAAASPVFERCVFLDNIAFGGTGSDGYGGAIATDAAEGANGTRLNVISCSLSGNDAAAAGGAIQADCVAWLYNDVFTGNVADGPGGAVYLTGNQVSTLSNCTVAYNASDYPLGAGGAFLVRTVVANSIFWGNSAVGIVDLDAQILESLSSVDYCDTDGAVWPSGTGNISDDPVFRDALGSDGAIGTLDDDVRLRLGSPCRNTGDNARVPGWLTRDRDGNPRIWGGVVDMGAYEWQIGFVPPPSP